MMKTKDFVEIKSARDGIEVLIAEREKAHMSKYGLAKDLQTSTSNIQDTEKKAQDITLSKYIRWLHVLKLRLVILPEDKS